MTGRGDAMDAADLDEMFSGLGAIAVRRMFGGQGIYHRGLIVAVVVRGEVLLKADAASAPAFAAAGARRWTYEGRAGRPVDMPYWSLPEAALDDSDEMARWARLAWEAALRAGPPKGSAKRKGAAQRPPPDEEICVKAGKF